MTREELRARGYRLAVSHSSVGVTISIRFGPDKWNADTEIGTVVSKFRADAMEAARQRAIAHFVEHRLNE